MAKATHRGTCQVCGRVQAVNAKTGLMAKHGYTVDWGWFNGTCRGSDHLPYEKSCDLVKKSVKWAEDHIVDLHEQIAKIDSWLITDEIPYRVYLSPGRYGRGGYTVKNVRIVEDIEKWGRLNLGIRFTVYNEEVAEVNRTSGISSATDLFEAAKRQHKDRLEKEIASTEHYREVQQKRVTDWVEADLMEIKYRK